MLYRKNKNYLDFLISAIFIGLILSGAASAQTTTFTYQGKLTDAGNPASGSYQMQFKLYNAPTGGVVIGAPVTNSSVTVMQGAFTVQHDFGEAPFASGANLYLEVSVLHSGGSTFTILSPRQQITSSPYAVRALSAAQTAYASQADLALDSNKLGGTDAGQFVTGQFVERLNGLTNNVTLAAGSNITITPSGNTLTIASNGGEILNQTALQTSANFNIDGAGKANIFDAATQYKTRSARFIRATDNFF